jgi:N-acetylmuramoyl-L-alanine amidase
VNRRRFMGLLGTAGAILALEPSWGLAGESSHDLAVRGQDLLGAGQTDRALEVLLRSRDLDPKNARAYALLGRAYFQRGEARQALAAFRLAVRLNPEDTLSRIMVETIELFPLPLQAGPGLSEPGRPAVGGQAGRDRSVGAGRPSSLEREAQAERARLMEQGRADRRAGPFRLLLDPGHGGSDPGAAGPGPREADVVLDLALRLARILAATPDAVAVSLTRVADAGLPGWARAGLAGYYDADWLVSLHATRLADTRASGLSVLALGREASTPLAAAVAAVENGAYGPEGPDGGRGGEMIFSRAVRRAAGTGLWRRGVEMAGLFVESLPAGAPLALRPLASVPLRLLAEADAPAMLVETGLLSNPADAAHLASAEARGALAQTLAQAVLAVVRAGKAPGPGAK